jgi:hypothetical protein
VLRVTVIDRSRYVAIFPSIGLPPVEVTNLGQNVRTSPAYGFADLRSSSMIGAYSASSLSLTIGKRFA